MGCATPLSKWRGVDFWEREHGLARGTEGSISRSPSRNADPVPGYPVAEPFQQRRSCALRGAPPMPEFAEFWGQPPNSVLRLQRTNPASLTNPSRSGDSLRIQMFCLLLRGQFSSAFQSNRAFSSRGDFVGFGPGFPGASGRPTTASSFFTKSSFPHGRPV